MEENVDKLFDVEQTTSKDNLVRKQFKLNNSLDKKTSFKEITADRTKKRLSTKKKMLIYVAIFLITTGLALYMLIKDNFLDTMNVLKNSLWWPLLVIVCLLFGVFLVQGLIWTLLSKIYKKDYKYHQGLFNGMIGNYFSNITPGYSGGQFAQAFIYKEQGINIANSASILLMELIIYQTCSVIFSTTCFISGYFGIVNNIKNIELFGISFSPLWIAGIGFVVNTLVIVAQFGLAYCKPLHRLICNQGVDLLAKMHLVSNPDKKRANLILKVATFRLELKRLLTNWKLMSTIVILTFVKIVLAYSIDYFACLSAAGLEGIRPTYGQAICLTGYLKLFASVFLTPGNSGAAELGFYQIFISFLGNNASVCNAANIISRTLSFYLRTVLGAIVFMAYHPKTTKRYEFKLSSATHVIYDLNVQSILQDNKLKEQYNQFYKENFTVEEKAKPLNKKELKESFDKIKQNIDTKTIEIPKSEIENALLLRSQKTLSNAFDEAQTLAGEVGNDNEILKELKKESFYFHKYKEKRAAKEKRKEEKRMLKKEQKALKELNNLQVEPTIVKYDNNDGIKIIPLVDDNLDNEKESQNTKDNN